MARIRSLHPGIHTDERYAALSDTAFRLWTGIIGEADDYGAFEWKPIQLKMRVLPAHNTDINALLSELEAADIVRRYEVDGKSYGAVRNFGQYQRPKKPKSVHPMPTAFRAYAKTGEPEAELTTPSSGASSEPTGVEAPSVPKKTETSPQMEDGGGRKKKEEPTGSSKKRGTRLRPDFEPDVEAGINAGLSRAEALAEIPQFFDHFASAPESKGVRLDWQATWRMWCRNAAKWRDERNVRRDSRPVSGVDAIGSAIAERRARKSAVGGRQALPPGDSRADDGTTGEGGSGGQVVELLASPARR